MKYIGYSLLLILALVLQTTFFPGWDIILLLALVHALLKGPREGAIFGFAGGLMQDLFIGYFIGLRACVTMFTCWLGGFLARRLYKENILVRFFIVSAGTLFWQITYLLGTMAFGRSPAISLAGIYSILTVSVLNGVISLGIFKPFSALNRVLIYWDEVLKRTG